MDKMDFLNQVLKTSIQTESDHPKALNTIIYNNTQ
jgi:hypothetical protein